MDTPAEIGRSIADAGALIGDEAKGVAKAAADAIRAERRGAIKFTQGEARAALEAISQMTDGNARCFEEWRKQTCGSYSTWLALLRAEAKLVALFMK